MMWPKPPPSYSDDVLFNDEAAQKTVNIDEEVIPNSFTVSNTAGYVFNGNGYIGGAASFTKEGTGMVTINNSNSYTGGNHLKGGATKVSQLSNQYNETGNLEASQRQPTSSPWRTELFYRLLQLWRWARS